jgi:ABC-type nickel/cobalt efflux system permease component RcnA
VGGTVPDATRQDHDLDARYGRSRDHRRRTRWLLAGAVVLVVLAGAWIVWGSLGNINSSLESNDLGHHVNDQYSMTVSFELSVTPGTAARCALQAQNSQHGIIGWKIVDIPASDRFTRSFTQTIRTAERAFTGLIYRCWVA